MADKIVQLIDGRTNDNIFPVTTNDAPIITVTSTDPGTGSSLAANHFVAVTGTATNLVGSSDLASDSVTTAKIVDTAVTTAKLADEAVTAAKVDFSSFAVPVFIGRVAFKRQNYNNGYLALENQQVLYAATGVSVSIQNNIKWQFTLPTDGLYVADVQSSLWNPANSWDYFLLAVRKNESPVVDFARAMGFKGGNWGFVNASGFTTVANGDFFWTYLNTDGHNFDDGNVGPNDSKMLIKIYRVG